MEREMIFGCAMRTPSLSVHVYNLIAYLEQSISIRSTHTHTHIYMCVLCVFGKRKHNEAAAAPTPPSSPSQKQHFQEQKSHLSCKQLLKFRNRKTIVYSSL